MNLRRGGQLASVDEPVSMTVNRTCQLLLPEKPQMRALAQPTPRWNGYCEMENMGTRRLLTRMEHRMKRWNLEVSDVDSITNVVN